MATNRAKPNTLNKPEYINFIKENIEGTSYEKLTKMFNEKFKTDLTLIQVQGIARRNGLKNHIPHSERLMTLTKEERKFIDDHYKGISQEELVRKLNEKFKTNRTTYVVTRYKRNNKYISGVDGKFQKNHIPHNKVEVGEERGTNKNIPRIKVKDEGKRDDWEFKHRYLYEKYHNVKLTKDDFVLFLDGDITNFSKDNLFCFSKEEIGSFYGKGLNKRDINLSKANALLTKINYKIKNLEK